MKPSWDEQRRNESRTDRKFRADGGDEHLLAHEKEELAKSHQGDKLAPDYRHEPGENDNDQEERATAP